MSESSMGYNPSEETRKKISKIHKGKKMSKEFSIKMSELKRGKNSKLTVDNVINIKYLLLIGKSNTEIAKLYNVKQNTISQIKTGKTWSHIIIDKNKNLEEVV